MKTKRLLALSTSLVLTCALTSADAEVLFFDNFDGSSTAALNGTTPDTTTGAANWVAANHGNRGSFKADGTMFLSTGSTSSTRGGSATLAYTPEQGYIYTLDVSISGLNTSTSHSTATPIYFGFGSGQSSGNGSTVALAPNDTSVTGKVVQAFNVKQGYNGNNGPGDQSFDATNGASWLGWSAGHGGNIDMRIVLDTTGGAGTWTATWYAKRPSDSGYTVTRATELITDETITSIGVGLPNRTENGTLNSFQLERVVPEPGSLALLGLGSLLIARRRR